MNKVFIAVLIVLLCVSCIDKESYKVGFLGTLSGSGAGLGEEGRNGFLLYIDRLNSSGGINGHKVDTFIYDVRGDQDSAVTGVETLYNEGVCVIVAHLTSGEFVKAFDTANKLNIPVITSTISSDLYANKDDMLFRIVNSNSQQGIVLGGVAVEKGFKRGIIVSDIHNIVLSKNIVEAFILSYKEHGSILEQFYYDKNAANSLTDIASKIAKYKPDFVLSILDAYTNANLCQNISVLGGKPQFLMSSWSVQKELIGNGGASVDGAIVTAVHRIDSNNREFVNFSDEYRVLYENAPGFSALFGYEEAKFIDVIFTESGKMDRDVIVKTLKSQTVFHGLQESIYLNEFGDAGRKNYLHKIENGKFISYK